MSAQNEQNREVIVFENLRRPSGEIAGDSAPVKAKAAQSAESFACSNGCGYARMVDSREDIKKIAGTSGSKFRAAFGK